MDNMLLVEAQVIKAESTLAKFTNIRTTLGAVALLSTLHTVDFCVDLDTTSSLFAYNMEKIQLSEENDSTERIREVSNEMKAHGLVNKKVIMNSLGSNPFYKPANKELGRTVVVKEHSGTYPEIPLHNLQIKNPHYLVGDNKA